MKVWAGGEKMKPLEETIKDEVPELTGVKLDGYIQEYQRIVTEFGSEIKSGPPMISNPYAYIPSRGLNIFSGGNEDENDAFTRYHANVRELKDLIYNMHRNLDDVSVHGKTEEDKEKARASKEPSDFCVRNALWPGASLPPGWQYSSPLQKLIHGRYPDVWPMTGLGAGLAGVLSAIGAGAYFVCKYDIPPQLIFGGVGLVGIVSLAYFLATEKGM